MTVKELYDNICGNYQEALGRLMKDALIQRFVLKFLQDPSFEQLVEKMAQGDIDGAFQAAHTLKGVCKNMAFTKLADSSSQITEILRNGNLAAAQEYLPVVTADYELTVTEIRKMV